MPFATNQSHYLYPSDGPEAYAEAKGCGTRMMLLEKIPATPDAAERKRLALDAAVMAKNQYTTLAILGIDSVFALSSRWAI